jgi:hypothetical protein
LAYDVTVLEYKLLGWVGADVQTETLVGKGLYDHKMSNSRVAFFAETGFIDFDLCALVFPKLTLAFGLGPEYLKDL